MIQGIVIVLMILIALGAGIHEAAQREKAMNAEAERMIGAWRAEGYWVEVYREDMIIVQAVRHEHGPNALCTRKNPLCHRIEVTWPGG